MARPFRVFLVAVGTLVASSLPVGAALIGAQNAGAVATPHTGTTTIYDSTTTVPVPSLGFEANGVSEAGNAITFTTGSPRYLTSVTVTMDSWGCETGGGATCTTTSGAGFYEPITLNLYNNGTGVHTGGLITSITSPDPRGFFIDFRPSSGGCADNTAFLWHGTTCAHGLPYDVTFTLPTPLLVPASLIWGVAYNTTDFGYTPHGPATCAANCGYDSLNLGLSTSDPSVGTDTTPGTIYWNTAYASNYCDGGAAGSGFRLDGPSGCWTGYVPEAQFNAIAPTKPSAPVDPTGVPGNGKVTVSWQPPTSNGTGPITGYTVTASPGGRTCTSTMPGPTTCMVTGLSNGTPYRFTVTATNSAGTGPGATTATVVPATTGFHVYASPPVVETHTPVTISETGAMANSHVTLSVVGRASATVTTDAYGSAYQSFTITNFGKFKIKAVQGAAQATGTLYVAIVYTPSSVRHGHQVNVGVTSAIPGSTLQVTTNRGGNYSVPVPSGGHVVVHIPGTTAGNLRITVTDAGWPLVVRNVPIT